MILRPLTLTENEKMKFQLELTDTFGGEANYAWCDRKTVELPENISDLALVRRAKREMGLTGVRCRRESFGDLIALYPYDACAVLFIKAEY